MNKFLLSATFFLFLAFCAARTHAGGMHEDVDVYGVELTEDTTVSVNDGDLLLQKGSGAFFYKKDGEKTDSLYTGTLAADASFSLQGKALMVPESNVVWFHESGNIKYTTAIAEPAVFTVQGKDVLFNEAYDVYIPMGFHDNGRLMRGRLSETTEFLMQDKPVLFKGTVAFSDTELLVYGTLAEDADVIMQGKPAAVPKDSHVSFYDTGEIKECGFLLYNTALKAGGKTVVFTSYGTAASAISFYQNGSVLGGSLAEDTVFTVGDTDIRFKAKTFIVFHETDGVKTGYLAEDSDLVFQEKPVRIPSGSAVEFDEEGNLIQRFDITPR